MPPRKNLSKETASATVSNAASDPAADGIDAYELPRALVTRIAKSALPENIKLQKEVVTALVKGSTVFINYLAATAQDVATSKQHKSVSAADVLRALEAIDFGDMVDGLQVDLQAFREAQKLKKTTTTSISAGTSSAKVKIPARPAVEATAASEDVGADSEVDEALLAELQESEGAEDDDEMDVDEGS